MAVTISGNRGKQQEISSSTKVSNEIVPFQQEFPIQEYDVKNYPIARPESESDKKIRLSLNRLICSTVVVLASNKYRKGCTRLNTNHPTSFPLESLIIRFPTFLSNKSDPKGEVREGHRELCPPDPNVPAAPGSSFGAHFLRVFVVQT